MKIKTFIFVFLLLCTIPGFTQEVNKYFTIYSNAFFERKPDILFLESNYQLMGLFPSITIGKEKHKLSYEIEYLPLLYFTSEYADTVKNNLRGGGKEKRFETSLSFITKYNLIQRERFEIKFLLENKLYFTFNSFDAYIRVSQSSKNIGWAVIAGFEIEKKMNDRFSLLLSYCYRFNELFYHIKFVDDPLVPKDKRETTEFNNKFNPNKFSFKFGLKYRFSLAQ